MRKTFAILSLAAIVALPRPSLAQEAAVEPATPTKEFEIRNDRPFLGGQPIEIWGLRCSNALYNPAVTERHINNLDTMTAHGLNCLAVYIQGSNTGWPVADGALNGFRRDGRLRPDVAKRLERLIRECDKRGMVVMVGLISPRKDQELYDEAAIKRAVEETGRFLVDRKLKNVFVDLCHEFDHPERMEQELLRGPDGPAKKAKLTAWFKAVAPDIEAGVCPNVDSQEGTTYPGMEVRIIQKQAPIPKEGFVVNVETLRQDQFENDGVFNQGHVDYILADCRRYLDAPNAVMLFHSAHCQGVTNKSGTAPNPEPGGYGKNVNDRGIRFYYDWVRDNVGRYEYPRHIKDSASTTQAPREGGR